MGPGAPDVAGAVGLLFLILAYFMVSFISAWVFFVNREIFRNWVWYFRHSTGAIVGVVFAVFVCSGILGAIYFSPIKSLWMCLIVGALIFVGIWLLGRRLLPVAQTNAHNDSIHTRSET